MAEDLTVKWAFRWSPQLKGLMPWGTTGRDAVSTTISPTVETITKWLSPEGAFWLQGKAKFPAPTVILVDVPHWSRPQSVEPSSPVTDGLVLRDAALGTLWVCETECPKPESDPISVDNVLSATSVVVPQLGPKFIFPLENGLFQSSVLDVSMSEDGVVTKLGVHSTPTAATGIKDIGVDAEATKSALDARSKAQADALTKAQNKARDENKALADCLDAQKTIVKDGGTPVGSCQ